MISRLRYPVVAAIAALAAACASPAPPATRAESATAAAAAAPAPGSPGRVVAPPATDAERIAAALTAAPAAIANDATIMTWDMRGLRVGMNGWTCIPDGPSPRVDPMCFDSAGSEWIMALMHGTEPPDGHMGLGYMLMGGWNARSAGPADVGRDAEGAWVDTGPHVMIVNIGDRFGDYPTTADDPTRPYIMWAGTPFAHLVIPLE